MPSYLLNYGKTYFTTAVNTISPNRQAVRFYSQHWETKVTDSHDHRTCHILCFLIHITCVNQHKLFICIATLKQRIRYTVISCKTPLNSWFGCKLSDLTRCLCTFPWTRMLKAVLNSSKHCAPGWRIESPPGVSRRYHLSVIVLVFSWEEYQVRCLTPNLDRLSPIFQWDLIAGFIILQTLLATETTMPICQTPGNWAA